MGSSLTELGVSLSIEEGCEEQDLDSILDQISRKHSSAPSTTLRFPEPTRGDNPRKRGREESESSAAGDTASDAWADDWGGTPALELLVDVQRGPPNSNVVRVLLSVRIWPTGESPLYVLTFAKPVNSPSSANFSIQSQPAEGDIRNVVKSATLARMKSSIFNQSSIPTYLFSADETIYYPNEAGKALAGVLEEDNMLERGSVIMAGFEVWDEKYTRRLSFAEFPGIRLVRSRQSFKEQRYGFVYPHTGKRLRLDVSGDCLYDEATGEFLGGVVWCRDVTDYTEMIAQQQLEIERGFENKLDYMPNLSWTARPDGEPDYFSKRWYDFTHASRNETFKDIWTRTVHPDDRDAMWDSWIQCTQKGQPFTTEARYKRFDGVYRYQLIHGVPQQNEKGEIVKWHGTSTDIHDLVTQRIKANRLKQQMLAVLSHAEVNLFGFDTQMAVTMLEGSVKWGTQKSASEKAALVGSELVDVVEKTSEEGAAGAADFIEAVQKILRGDSVMEFLEHTLDKRWYRTRFIADIESDNESGLDTIRGVLGLSIDITDMKARVALELEKTQLVANEIAAKEANMLKSQFLANVSHELRTPISGVLGMADLLAETPLADEQREYARGISQSADSLLGIVNDILDASKIEAGRFDIESVEFNLSRVLEDLYKMMAYAAQRKNLKLIHNTQLASVERVIGDPGRTRQILVNL
jgi:signal transduction histidine kinase